MGDNPSLKLAQNYLSELQNIIAFYYDEDFRKLNEVNYAREEYAELCLFLDALSTKNLNFFNPMAKELAAIIEHPVSSAHFYYTACQLLQAHLFTIKKDPLVFKELKECKQLTSSIGLLYLMIKDFMQPTHFFLTLCSRWEINSYELEEALSYLILLKKGGNKKSILEKIAQGALNSIQLLKSYDEKHIVHLCYLLGKQDDSLGILSIEQILQLLQKTCQEIIQWKDKYYQNLFKDKAKPESGPKAKSKEKNKQYFKEEEIRPQKAPLNQYEWALSILELPAEHNLTQLKKAYRKMAMQKHPDRQQALNPKAQNIKEMNQQFIEVGQAYSFLLSKIKK